MAERPILVAAAAAPAVAKPKVDNRALALGIIDGFVIPAYRNLIAGTKDQVAAWTYFAKDPAHANFGILRTNYDIACDAWAVAQTVRMGPISLFLRYDRFAYWPEARNATQNALNTLLSGRDPKDLLSETLSHDSVAGQGLTAIERLLYDGAAPWDLMREQNAAGKRRVAVGLALAHNLDVIANDALRDWTAPNGVRAMVAANKGWNNLFADAAEAAHLLLTDLSTAFKTMHDVKLMAVLDADAKSAKPKLAEAWRSRRSARDLKVNFSAAYDMEKQFGKFIPPQHQAAIAALFDKATAALANVPADLGDAAADPKRRPRIEAARIAIKAVQNSVVATLPADTGLTIGFNGLDGD